MSKSLKWLLCSGSIGLGLVFSIFFVKCSPGIVFPVFILLCLAFLFAVQATAARNSMRARDWLYAIPIAALSLCPFLFDNPVLNVLDIMLVAILLVCLSVRISGKDKTEPSYASAFMQILFRPLTLLAQLFIELFSNRSKPEERPDSRKGSLKMVVLGLLTGLLCLLVILPLLAGADAVFSSMLGSFWREFTAILRLENFLNFWAYILAWVLAAMFIFAWLYHMFLYKKPPKPFAQQACPQRQKVSKYWPPAFTIPFLSLITVVYLVFSTVQIVCVFAARGALPAGISYSQYTHQGFWQLAVLSLLNALLIFLSSKRLAPDKTAAFRTVQLLLTLIVLCSAVMLASTVLRLYLYQQQYGYTVLRLYVFVFCIFAALLLCIGAVCIYRQGLCAAKMWIAAGLALFIALNYVNYDALIAQKNIDRYFETGKLDAAYLSRLSLDAAPQIMRLENIDDSEIKDNVEVYRTRAIHKLEFMDGWQSWNIARGAAEKALR